MIKLGRVIKNQEAIKTAKGRDEIFEGKIHEDPLRNMIYADIRSTISRTNIRSVTCQEAP
jgi:hypothetical protein